MDNSFNSPPFIERHFWKFVGAPLAITALCVGYAALSATHHVNPATSDIPATVAEPEPAPKAALTQTQDAPPVAQVVPLSQPMHEPEIEPHNVAIEMPPPKATPIVTNDDRDLGFAKSDAPAQPDRPFVPAGRVAPDPTDMPYVVPPNKPFIGQPDPKAPDVTPNKPEKPARPLSPKALAPKPAQPAESAAPKANERAVAKTFVLKDGRRIEAATVADQGDSYSVEDGNGHAEEFLKSEVHLIISRR